VRERIDGILLVGADVPAVLGEFDLVRGARRVAGEVLGRPTDLQQFLFDLAACPGVDDVGVGVRTTDEQRLDALVVRDLCEYGRVGRSQDQQALVVALDDQAPVAIDRLAQIDRDGRRHGEP